MARLPSNVSLPLLYGVTLLMVATSGFMAYARIQGKPSMLACMEHTTVMSLIVVVLSYNVVATAASTVSYRRYQQQRVAMELPPVPNDDESQ
jgi:hypothetical protein